jgi:hypothetical protein
MNTTDIEKIGSELKEYVMSKDISIGVERDYDDGSMWIAVLDWDTISTVDATIDNFLDEYILDENDEDSWITKSDKVKIKSMVEQPILDELLAFGLEEARDEADEVAYRKAHAPGRI